MNIIEYLNEKFENYPETDEYTELHETLIEELTAFIEEKKSQGMDEAEATKLAILNISDLDQLLTSMSQASPDFTKSYNFYTSILNTVNQLQLFNEIDVSLDTVDEIHLNYHHGNLTFIPSQDDQVHVREFMSRDIEKIYSTAVKVGNVLNITQGPRKLVGIFREKIEIAIPNEFQGFLTLSATSNNIHIINLKSKCMLDLTVKSGNVNLVDLETTRIQSDISSGNIKAKQLINSDLHLNTKSGNIKLDNVTIPEDGDQLALSTKSGSIKLTNINAPTTIINSRTGSVKINQLETNFFDIATSTGNTKISNLNGGGKLSSKTGSINLEFTHPGEETTISNTTGSTKIIVLPGNNYQFGLKSTTGSLKIPDNAKVTSYKDQNITGQVGQLPDSSIKIKSTTGSIKLS